MAESRLPQFPSDVWALFAFCRKSLLHSCRRGTMGQLTSRLFESMQHSGDNNLRNLVVALSSTVSLMAISSWEVDATEYWMIVLELRFRSPV
eukprot:889677-Amphidinium_carterae.1